MTSGRIDIFQSRRTHFFSCAWWSRDESGVGNSEEEVYNTTPTGIFYARPITSENDRATVIQGAFMADAHNITIESNDDLTGIKVNDLVRFDNKIWIVDSSPQKLLRNKVAQFSGYNIYKWTIALRR